MPTYRNDNSYPVLVKDASGHVVSVAANASVQTTGLVSTLGMTKTSDLPPLKPDAGGVIALFGNEIAATGYEASVPLEVAHLEGFFGVACEISGTGTCKLEIELSQDGSSWNTASGASAAFSTKGSADSPVMAQLSPGFSKYMRLKITEDGGAASVTPTVNLTVK